jgi:proliferating cell nuclear antigen
MFEAEINASKLQDTVSKLTALVDECKARLDEDGLSIQAVDAANVAMVDVWLPKEDFAQYQSDEELLGVNLVRLSDVVGMGGKGDTVTLELNEQTRKLRIEIDGLRYTLSLIDPDSIHQEPNVPELDNPTYTIMGGEIQQAVKASGLVSDHMGFRSSPELNKEGVVQAFAEGDTDDVSVDMPFGDVYDAADEKESSLFSLDYLDAMSKELPSDEDVCTELGDDYPIKFSADLGEEGGMTYLLAPRIEND